MNRVDTMTRGMDDAAPIADVHIPSMKDKVSAEEWEEVQQRLRAAYDEFCGYARSLAEQPANGDRTGSLTGAVAHVAYHLGAIRQLQKALRAE